MKNIIYVFEVKIRSNEDIINIINSYNRMIGKILKIRMVYQMSMKDKILGLLTCVDDVLSEGLILD